jgi:hypothetical protein
MWPRTQGGSLSPARSWTDRNLSANHVNIICRCCVWSRTAVWRARHLALCLNQRGGGCVAPTGLWQARCSRGSSLGAARPHIAGYLLHLFFNPEDTRNVFFRNVREFLPDWTVSHPRRNCAVAAWPSGGARWLRQPEDSTAAGFASMGGYKTRNVIKKKRKRSVRAAAGGGRGGRGEANFPRFILQMFPARRRHEEFENCCSLFRNITNQHGDLPVVKKSGAGSIAFRTYKSKLSTTLTAHAVLTPQVIKKTGVVKPSDSNTPLIPTSIR